jgi:hypothetical protein
MHEKSAFLNDSINGLASPTPPAASLFCAITLQLYSKSSVSSRNHCLKWFPRCTWANENPVTVFELATSKVYEIATPLYHTTPIFKQCCMFAWRRVCKWEIYIPRNGRSVSSLLKQIYRYIFSSRILLNTLQEPKLYSVTFLHSGQTFGVKLQLICVVKLFLENQDISKTWHLFCDEAATSFTSVTAYRTNGQCNLKTAI